MNNLPRTRHSLLIRLKEHSQDAWSEFLEVYQNSIVVFAEKKGLQNADALDVTQEVLLAVQGKLKDWDSDPAKGKFRGWLFRVVRNIAVDRIKKKIRQPVSGDVVNLDGFSDGDEKAEPEEFQAEYQKQVLFWAMKRVKPRFEKKSWDAFWMTAIEGLAVDVVAAKTGLTAGKIYAAKFRVTSQVKKIIARLGEADSLSDILIR